MLTTRVSSLGAPATLPLSRAFLWTRQTGMRNLSELAAGHLPTVMIEARATNHKGQILVLANEPAHTAMNAQTITADGRERAKYVCTAAPAVDSAAHTHRRAVTGSLRADISVGPSKRQFSTLFSEW